MFLTWLIWIICAYLSWFYLVKTKKHATEAPGLNFIYFFWSLDACSKRSNKRLCRRRRRQGQIPVSDLLKFAKILEYFVILCKIDSLDMSGHIWTCLDMS